MDYLISDMLALANEKYWQISALLELTLEQTDLLTGQNMQSLESNIDDKQAIIDRFDVLNAKFKELEELLLVEAGVHSLEDLKENSKIEKMLELDFQMKQVLKTIVEVDAKNAAMAKQWLEFLGKKLASASRAPVAFKEYQQQMPGAIFVNRQG